MTVGCDAAMAWWAEHGAEGSLEASEAPEAAHFAGCEPCTTAVNRYRQFVDDASAACVFEPAAGAADAFIEEARDGADDVVEPLLGAEVAEAFAHVPSDASAAAFLQAARTQQEPAVARSAFPWGAVVAMAAAFVAIIALWPGSKDTLKTRDTPAAAARLDIAQVVGNVRVNGEPLGAHPKAVQPAGARIATAAGARVALGKPSMAVVTVHEKSQVDVKRWGHEATRLHLAGGSLRASVEHRADGAPFEIVTPNAVVSVVGTEFTVAYEAGRGTVVSGHEGVVQVDRPDGTLVGRVAAGQTLRVDEERADEPSAGPGTGEGASKRQAAAEPNTAAGAQNPKAKSAAAKSPKRTARARRRGGRNRAATKLKPSMQNPGSAAALERVGDHLLANQRWSDAETLFAGFMRRAAPPVAEVALIGMVRVRIGQGRQQDAARLLKQYRQRFPRGQRRAQAHRLQRSLAAP